MSHKEFTKAKCQIWISGIKLTKKMNYFYNENYKTQMKELEEDIQDRTEKESLFLDWEK